jgi:hypothetical protein
VVWLRAGQLSVAVGEWHDDPLGHIAAGLVARDAAKRGRRGRDSAGSGHARGSVVDGPPPILQLRIGLVLPSQGSADLPVFVPALFVDGWRFPHLFGPGLLRVTFARASLPRGRDVRDVQSEVQAGSVAQPAVAAR